MPSLRLKTRKFFSSEITVPVLIDGNHCVPDSFEIAKYIDRIGQECHLLPSAELSQIKQFNDLSETILSAGRALGVPKFKTNLKARQESIPAFFPKMLRPYLLPVVEVGLNYICREFQITKNQNSQHTERLTHALLQFRAALGHKPYLLNSFSYADITMAAALQFVKPATHDFTPMPPGIRECFTNEELSLQFEDLLNWRNLLYEKHLGDAKF